MPGLPKDVEDTWLCVRVVQRLETVVEKLDHP